MAGAARVAGLEDPERSVELSPPSCLSRRRRRQLRGELGQLAGNHGRAPRACGAGSLVELVATAASGPSAARARCRARSSGPTASCAGLRAHRVSAGVEPSYAAAARSGWVKRTRPSSSSTTSAGTAGSSAGSRQRRPPPRRSRAPGLRAQRRRAARRVSRREAPAIRAPTRSRRLFGTTRRAPADCPSSRPEARGELEREQWVAPRRRVDLPERRPREDPAQPRPDQVVHVLESEWRDPNPREPWQGALRVDREPGRLLEPQRDEEADSAASSRWAANVSARAEGASSH